MSDNIIQFTKQKEYEHVRNVGQGGLGKTILIRDSEINESFVCKKYEPFDPSLKEEYYENFKTEIKLMYKLYHKNIIRIFNYHLYPKQFTGYIVMEYVEGNIINDYILQNPENISSVFYQTIEAFCYLEENNILHRDIRIPNILVDNNGVVKVIDFGFGKQIFNVADYDKSISLNWWCETPNEFNNKIYDFKTEVYFIGMLFRNIIEENEINFENPDLLNKMTQLNDKKRISSFREIKNEIESKGKDIDDLFNVEDKHTYRSFANSLIKTISKIKGKIKFSTDYDSIMKELNDIYKVNMLDEEVLNMTSLINIFINVAYSYKINLKMPIWVLKDFIKLIRSCDEEQFSVLLMNLHNKIKTIDVEIKTPNYGNDIPF